MNVQREAIRDFKIENASTFSQVTVPVSPCVLPLITCTLHPPVTLLLSPAPSSHRRNVSRHRSGSDSGSGPGCAGIRLRPARAARLLLCVHSIYSAMRLLLRHAHPHLTSSLSSLLTHSHDSHPHPSLPPFPTLTHPPTYS